MNWDITPTAEQPLLFFDFFFGSGLREFYYEFFGYSNADLFGENNTQKTVVLLTKKEEDAGATGEQVLFEEELYKLLTKHQKLALNAVVAFFRTCNERNKCNHYLDITANELIILTQGCKDKDLIEKYPLILHLVLTTIHGMYQSGGKYFPKSPMRIPDNVASILEKYFNNPEIQFNLRYVHLIEPLLLSLQEHGFIHQDTELKDFEPALIGRAVSKPKIKWIKKGIRNTNSISKANIYHLYDKLRKEKLIQFTSDRFLKKHVQNNFLDDNGEELKNVQGSFTDYKNQGRISEESELINDIIDGLLTHKQS